ncbi:SIS domain-containing protein [Micromonospora sp. NPDC007271]|uniref:D-sedoheptulose-7-phosphate isomerase n=1 Tax=Micromonospora sp. NPDC007271 TaxID=3154587 RepID=UPI0033D33F05
MADWRTMPSPVIPAVDRAFARRVAPGAALAADAERIARTCYEMAVRFHRGGKLIVFGNGGPATDAQHVVVEFVHPVIMGKRALPAISLTNDAATLTGIARADGFDEVFAAQLRLLAAPEDIALGLSADGRCANVRRGLAAARDLGLLTVGLLGGDGGDIARDQVADHVVIARSDDPCVVKEVHVTTYHVLWELVHVFFEQPGLLDREVVR